MNATETQARPPHRPRWWRTAPRNLTLLLALALVVNAVAGFASVASAATTTTQFASGMTAPQSGLILSGTAINPATGKPFRHLWYGDFANGLCRLDPDVDTVSTTRTLNQSTCMHFVFGAQFKPGQLAFDPFTNNIYAVDIQAKTQGIFRLHFLPSGDSGHGALDLVHQEVLGGLNNGCGVPGNIPDTAVLGPDGNLYVGFKRSGNLLRIVAPQTEPLPCSNIQVIGTTGDQRKDFGLGWIGHDLYGGDGFSPWVIPNADQCNTALNGFVPCHGASILAGTVPVPSAITSNQIYPALNGTHLYYANPNTVTLLQVLPTQQVTLNYAAGFQFISGLTVDTANPAGEVLYVGDDPANGFNPGLGHWWQVSSAPVAPPPPPPPATDLALTMTGPASVVAAGSNATYTLTVVNNGPASAPQVLLTDTIPTTATLVSDLPSQGTCSLAGASLSCNLGSLGVGASATVTVTLQLSATTSNSATVGATDATGAVLPDPNPANNSASVTTTVPAPAPAPAPASTTTTDLQVTGSSNNGGPKAGTAFTYTWQVKNAGPQVANAVSFTDTLPPDVTFQSVSTNLGTCTGPAVGSVGGTISCSLGSLPVGQTQVVTVGVQAGTTLGTVANTASATFAGTDTQPANNSFTVNVQIQ